MSLQREREREREGERGSEREGGGERERGREREREGERERRAKEREKRGSMQEGEPYTHGQFYFKFDPTNSNSKYYQKKHTSCISS